MGVLSDTRRQPQAFSALRSAPGTPGRTTPGSRRQSPATALGFSPVRSRGGPVVPPPTPLDPASPAGSPLAGQGTDD